MMRAQLEAEFIKMKRKKMVLAMFCFLAAAVSLIGVYFHFASVSEPWFHSFGKFTERCMSVISMLLPFLAGMLLISQISCEYRYHTIKEILQIPISMNRLLFVKVMLNILVLFIILVLLVPVMLLFAIVLKTGISVEILMGILVKSGALAILTPMSLMPIILITQITKSNAVLITSLEFIYIIIGLAGGEKLAGVHPVSSILTILWGGESISQPKVLMAAWLNIIAMSTVFTLLICLKNHMTKLDL